MKLSEDLRRSVLQAAIQGQLTEQRAEDGNAEDLLKEIRDEKEKLISEGKIKREKILLAITDDEKPFEIPDNWVWVRLGEVITHKTGLSYKKENLEKKSENTVRILRGGNIFNLGYQKKNDDIFISSEFVKEDLFLKRNILITPAVTSIENIGKIGRIENDYNNMVVGGFVLMLIPILLNDIISKFLLFCFSSPYLRELMKKITHKSGQAFYNLSREKLMELLIPLPPLAEQKRIVERVEAIMSKLDELEKAENELEALKKNFPDDMRDSLLQAAVQGKLTEQKPDDGNAEDLLKKIRADKEKLISDGKIKREKILPPINDDEKPFEIPDNWEWVRLGELGIYKKGPFGSSLTKSIFIPDGNKSIKVYEQKNAIQKDWRLGEYFISEEYYNDNMKGFTVCSGDIIVSCAGTIGETYVLPEGCRTGIINQALMRISLMKSVYKDFYLLYFNHIIKNMAQLASQGTAVKNIPPFSILKNMLMALPPLAEQKRIVERLNELLPLCEAMKGE